MPNRGESFRMSFLVILVFLLVFSTAFALLFSGVLALLLLPLRPVVSDLIGVVAMTAVIDVMAPLGAALIVWYFKIYLAPDGLHAYDFWGLYRTVTWADILSAHPFNFLGLRFLRVRTAGARSRLWLPLFLTEPERFYRLVLEHAGPDHVLARALNDELFGHGDF